MRKKLKKPYMRLSKSSEDSDKCAVFRVNRTLYFFDDVTSLSVAEALKYLAEIEAESIKKPIEFVINTYGGQCYEGFALYDKLRSSECEIVTVATGIVASMGVPIYLGGSHRLITENAKLMYHKGKGGAEGNIDDINVEYKELKAIEDQCNSIVADRTNQNIKKILKEIHTADYYITPDMAIKDGYAHELIINKRTRRRKIKK